MDVKDQIKSQVSIYDVASLYVNLKPAGKNFKSLCPFHTEKTPSFFIHPEKNNFTCFGCNRFGDVFTLVQEMEHISFPEAIDFLIEKFNLVVDRRRQGEKKEKGEYRQINEMALSYFKENLFDEKEGETALAYLKNRGIQTPIVEEFSIGYALNQWDGLLTWLNKKGVDCQKALELGLLVRSKDKIYDRFRGRIIFPIFSDSGSILAFGGRTVFDDPAKYINSPDTPIYKKGEHLFAFNLAKEHIRGKKLAILVEGYLDVISLFQKGLTNAVASLGTALTDRQIYLLKRFTDRICLFYDSDEAGISATVMGIERMFEQCINPMVVVNPQAKDPDEFIRKKGVEAFNRLIGNAQDGFKFILHKVTGAKDMEKPEQKRQAIGEVLDIVGRIPDGIIRQEYIKKTADYFKVDADLIKLNRQKQAKFKEDIKHLELTVAENCFLKYVLAMPEIIPQVKELFTEEILSILTSRNIIRLIFQNYIPDKKDIDYDIIARQLEDSERATFSKLFVDKDKVPVDIEMVRKRIADSYVSFHKRFNKLKLHEINQEIALAEKEQNLEKVKQLMTKKSKYYMQKISQKRKENQH